MELGWYRLTLKLCDNDKWERLAGLARTIFIEIIITLQEITLFIEQFVLNTQHYFYKKIWSSLNKGKEMFWHS